MAKRSPRKLVLAVGLAVLLNGAAHGAEEGILNAVAYSPLPKDAAIAVRPLDNSDQNMAVKLVFERELRRRGRTVSDDAALVLTFETSGQVGAWTSAGRRSVLELDAHGGRTGGENAQARLNIFDSARGGLLNKGRGGRTSIVTPSRYRLDATIDERESGRRLWKAWAVSDLGQSDGTTLARAMVPVVVGTLGRTVKRHPFSVP